MVIDLHISFVVGLAFERNDMYTRIYGFFSLMGVCLSDPFIVPTSAQLNSAQVKSTIPKATHTSLIMFTSAIVIPLK